MSALMTATRASALVGVGLTVMPAVAAAAPDCQSSFDPYQASEATLAACGMKQHPRKQVITRADGSTEHVYMVGDDEVRFRTPPKGFNPMAASAADRHRYGIPDPPPSDQPERQQQWRELMGRLHWVEPPEELVESRITAGNASSQNWSGPIAIKNTNYFTNATGEYVEPSDHGTSCAGNAAVFWTGIGGNGPNVPLAQDGTAINSPGLGQHQAWYEILPDNPYVVPVNLYATQGQTFKAKLQHLNSNSWEFTMTNLQTGANLDFTVTTKHTTARRRSGLPSGPRSTSPTTRR